MDWKAMKKLGILAACSLPFFILYLSASAFGLNPFITALIRMAFGFLTLTPLIAAALAAAVLGIRYLLVVKKAVDRDKDYTPHPKRPTAQSKKNSADKTNTHEKSNEAEKRYDALIEKWQRGELQSPLSDLVFYYVEMSESTHATYFEHALESVQSDASASAPEEDPLQRIVYDVTSLLPTPLRENLARAFVATREEFDDLSLESVLEQCDLLYAENKDVITAIIQDAADKMFAK